MKTLALIGTAKMVYPVLQDVARRERLMISPTSKGDNQLSPLPGELQRISLVSLSYLAYFYWG